MKAIHKLLIAGFALCAVASCNEQEWLTEVPYSIYSTENALVSESDYQAMVNHLYYQIKRSCVYIDTQDCTGPLRSGEFSYYSRDFKGTSTKDWGLWDSFVTPENTDLYDIWEFTWDLICNANVVISRVPDSDLSESVKNTFLGEALFARSWGYTYLCHLYGGLPILDGEVTSPARDYSRETRKDTYKFAYDGFAEATKYLPNVDKAKPGQANVQICQHFMAECAICMGDYDQAITDATKVINYSGCSLVTERFGALKDKPGDLYWDMFRMNNTNYQAGNHEGLYVYQVDYKCVASPYSGNTKFDTDYLVRDCNCSYFEMKYTYGPYVGATVFHNKPVTDYGGRSYGYQHPTDHFLIDVWEGMDGDIRNSEYNIKRDIQLNNKSHADMYGKWLVADGILAEQVANGYDTRTKDWWPIMTKTANTTYDWPDAEKADLNWFGIGGYLAQTSTGRDESHKDWYMARLAETYLLRAEAYVGKGDSGSAAADINVLRKRASAPLVSGTVDIDYVLDERMRELYLEENRTVTLMRMGKFVERVKKYNPIEAEWGKVQSPKHDLFPIPSSEFSSNVFGENFEQNPGYAD